MASPFVASHCHPAARHKPAKCKQANLPPLLQICRICIQECTQPQNNGSGQVWGAPLHCHPCLAALRRHPPALHTCYRAKQTAAAAARLVACLLGQQAPNGGQQAPCPHPDCLQRHLDQNHCAQSLRGAWHGRWGGWRWRTQALAARASLLTGLRPLVFKTDQAGLRGQKGHAHTQAASSADASLHPPARARGRPSATWLKNAQ